MYLGDIALSQVLNFTFTTVQATGAPTSLLGTPVLQVYKSNSTTQCTTVLSVAAGGLIVDLDGITGLNCVTVDTSVDPTFYAAGNDFHVIITTGTVNSVSVVGYTVGTFSINNRTALRPTTAGRTLDVAATGEAGLDFDNVHDATGAHTLTNITVPTVTTAAAVNGLTPGNLDAKVSDVKTQTDKLVFTGTGKVDASVRDWMGDTIPARAVTGEPVVTLGATQAAYAPAKAGDAMLITAGTGTGQLDVTSGVVKANLVQILAAAITGTAAQIVAAFTKFFDKASPTGTVNSLPDAVAGATGGVAIVGSVMGKSPATLASTDVTGNLPVADSSGITTLLTRISQTIEFAHVSTHYYVMSDLVSILGTAITETAGQIAAAFTKFFNKASPTGTVNSLPDAVPGANGGLPTTNGTKVNQTVDLTSGQSIAVSDKTGFSLSAAGVLAIWNQLTTDAGIITSSFAKLIKDYLNAAVGSIPTTPVLTTHFDSVIGTPEGASLAADIAEIDADTDELITTIGAAGAGLTAVTATVSAADIRTAVGLATANLDTQLAEIEGETDDIALIKADYARRTGDYNTVAPDNTDIASAKAVTDKLDTMIENSSGDRFTTHALMQAPTGSGGGGDVTLAASQPNYAPAKAGDAMALISAYDAAKTAAKAGDAMTLTAAYDAAKTVAPTASAIDTQLSSTHGSGVWGTGGTGGALTLTYTLTSSISPYPPVEGATVELYATSGMTTIIDSQITNAFGQVTFSNLVAGTYYLKCIKSGYTTSIDTETIP